MGHEGLVLNKQKLVWSRHHARYKWSFLCVTFYRRKKTMNYRQAAKKKKRVLGEKERNIPRFAETSS